MRKNRNYNLLDKIQLIKHKSKENISNSGSFIDLWYKLEYELYDAWRVEGLEADIFKYAEDEKEFN